MADLHVGPLLVCQELPLAPLTEPHEVRTHVGKVDHVARDPGLWSWCVGLVQGQHGGMYHFTREGMIGVRMITDGPAWWEWLAWVAMVPVSGWLIWRGVEEWLG